MRSAPGMQMMDKQGKPTQVLCTCGAVIATLAANEAVYPTSAEVQGRVRYANGVCTCDKLFSLRIVEGM